LILAQLLSENKSKSLGLKEVDFAKNIYKSGTDLLMLINEILDLSKVESGKMELDIDKVLVEDMITDISSLFTEVAKNKSIDFRIKTSPRVKSISSDKLRVEQVLRNLLSNAFKFTPHGGSVSLAIELENGFRNYRNRKLNEATGIVSFSVTDNGIGIPTEKQSIIFEAFQQADGSTKRKYGGTGLGLSISRELAYVLGGEIHVESEEGKGSRFTLFLPVNYDDSVSVSTEQKSPDELVAKQLPRLPGPSAGMIPDDRYNINHSDKVVLIIEDDAEFAKILGQFLSERRYKVILAHEGATGLSYARHYKPDAIILDMKMPGMEGIEVLKHLKNDPELRHIPVQIISGYDKRKQGMELGAFDFIQKPVTKDDLQHAFDRIELFLDKKLKQLLIVEDDKQQNRAICELVGDTEVKCISAFSGSEAYELLEKNSFECVIIDLGLPDMTGFELLEKIRAEKRLAKIPLIIYTGRDLSKEEANRLKKLADTVVLKTVDSHERLLDETTLFLHRVESRLPKEKQQIIRQLHKTSEILKNKRVLVVDDDIRNIYSLTNILEDEGIHCVTAENGKVAVKALHDNPSIDMVLMDVMMPEMDGYEATKEIRANPRYSKLPIIALTAKAMKGDREKCLQAGMSDYIPKPVNVDQLLSLMRVWLYQ
jgi:CheY-like chemotaxis protein/two-component sensor histidine kinase